MNWLMIFRRNQIANSKAGPALIQWSIIFSWISSDGSSQNPGIVQSRTGGRFTHRDRHLNNGRRSEASSATPVHLGLLRNIYSPLLPLKEQLTISPTPIRYKEGMNVTFNAPTDKRQVYINGRLRRKRGKKTHKHTNTQTHWHIPSTAFSDLHLLTLASETLWQAPHRCKTALLWLSPGSR